MKIQMSQRAKLITACVACFSLGSIAMAQFKIGELVKLVGVTAAVAKFGPQINSAANHVVGWHDTYQTVTKVVPILSGGLNSRKAVGAAQVKGPKSQVAKVNAVAMLDQRLFGEFNLDVLVPISSKDVIKDLKPVPQVGVTAILNITVHI